MKHNLKLSLPPSVNSRFIIMKGRRQFILSPEARKYRDDASKAVQLYCEVHNIKEICKYTFFDLSWYIDNYNKDHHNMEKSLFDVMQFGGIVKFDKFIMNRTKLVEKDAENPRVIIEWEEL